MPSFALQSTPLLCLICPSFHWNLGRADPQVLHHAGGGRGPEHLSLLPFPVLRAVVDLERLEAVGDQLLRSVCGLGGSHRFVSDLLHADADEPLGALGHARLQLPAAARVLASSAVFVGLGLSQLPFGGLRGRHPGVCGLGCGTRSGGVVFHHDDPGEQVVCPEGLLSVPHADLHLRCSVSHVGTLDCHGYDQDFALG